MDSSKIVIYSKEYCPYCDKAKLLLSKGYDADFEEVRIDTDPSIRDNIANITGRSTVPQIFIYGKHVGGYDDLHALHKDGKLSAMLKKEE